MNYNLSELPIVQFSDHFKIQTHILNSIPPISSAVMKLNADTFSHCLKQISLNQFARNVY